MKLRLHRIALCMLGGQWTNEPKGIELGDEVKPATLPATEHLDEGQWLPLAVFRRVVVERGATDLTSPPEKSAGTKSKSSYTNLFQTS